MNEAKEFYDNFAVKLAKDMIIGNPRTEGAILFASRIFQREFRKSILDLGCGIGWSSYEVFRALSEATVHGLDLSSTLIQAASAMFAPSDKLTYECGDLTEESWMKDKYGKYDACAMLDVYEHIPNSSRELFNASLSSVLTDDAVIVLTCPTAMHQDYVREHQPDGLQPVDENISIDVLMQLAKQTSSELIYFENVSIWGKNDYFRAALARNPKRDVLRATPSPHMLLSKQARLEFVQRAATYFNHQG